MLQVPNFGKLLLLLVHNVGFYESKHCFQTLMLTHVNLFIPSAFTVEQASGLVDSISGQLSQAGVSSSVLDDVQQKCRQIQSSVQTINEEQHKLSIR